MKTKRREIRKTKTTERKETDPGVQEGNENAQAAYQEQREDTWQRGMN